ncbi:hypothetical protein Stupor_243 [Acinetobacter phage Stupor]|nr:hypothetical protein Stupor_243 [Acinetobacter phage Stupor]
MSNNQLLGLVLMICYATVHKMMPPMDFTDSGYLFGLALTSIITFVICFKLIK